MPIRIKPINTFSPCIITLDGLKEISKLVEAQFTTALYSATDGIWEIYDEHQITFFDAVGKRTQLDSFNVKAIVEEVPKDEYDEFYEEMYIELIFNETTGRVMFQASPDHERWFQHFLTDLNVHLLRPSFAQLLVYTYENPNLHFRSLSAALSMPIRLNNLDVPYCKIVIQKTPPNPLLENIKANLLSSIIWVFLTILFTLMAQWVFSLFGIDLNPFD